MGRRLESRFSKSGCAHSTGAENEDGGQFTRITRTVLLHSKTNQPERGRLRAAGGRAEIVNQASL